MAGKTLLGMQFKHTSQCQAAFEISDTWGGVMADVGAIGVGGNNSFLAKQDYNFFANAGYPLTGLSDNKSHEVSGQTTQYQTQKVNLGGVSLTYLEAAQTYTVSGMVQENGVAVARRVQVFNRANGVLLGEMTSASNGAFAIPLLGFNGEVTVIAYDDDSGASFNARVFDRVIPA